MQSYPLDADTRTHLMQRALLCDAPTPLSVERQADAQVYVYTDAWNTPEIARSYIIGAFDGMHVGHQALVHDACAYARAHDTLAVAVTFDPDPSALVGAAPQALLLTLSARVRALAAAGVDAVVVLRFTPELMKTSYQDFCSKVLQRFGKLASLHVGADFALGAQAQGTVEALTHLGKEQGFVVMGHPLVEVTNGTVTATRIRALLQQAQLDQANELLGRCYCVHGRVEHGREQGASFGFPTANVHCDKSWCFPQQGVYACMLYCDGHAWPAAVNVGAPPTFTEEKQNFLEAHLLGFEGDLYTKEVDVAFISFLRLSKKFPSLEELKKTVVGNIQWIATNIGTAPMEVSL